MGAGVSGGCGYKGEDKNWECEVGRNQILETHLKGSEFDSDALDSHALDSDSQGKPLETCHSVT